MTFYFSLCSFFWGVVGGGGGVAYDLCPIPE